MPEKIETVIVGGGQAGLALSYYLTQAGREHIILEKASQPAEAWRNRRWDSFTLVTPNWTFALPGGEYQGDEPGGYMARDEIVHRMEQFVDRYDLPVVFDKAVEKVTPGDGQGYLVETNGLCFQARNVVVATGFFQQGKVLPFATEIPREILQITSDQYRNPAGLPPGAVVVVGSAQTGGQIAEELVESGRQVYLSTGKTGWVPRRYRGKDIVDWLNQIGFFDRTADMLPTMSDRFNANPMATGKNGGHDLNLHTLHRKGVRLLGRLRGVQDGRLIVAADLHDNIRQTDEKAHQFLQKIDELMMETGIAAAAEPINFPADAYQSQEVLELDLKEAKISTIVWACGYSFDFNLVKLPIADEFGYPVNQRGITKYPGLYFLGLPWLSKMKSGLLFGVGEDAAYLAEQISAGK